MSLFQPTNITPSTLGGLGNGVVDANINPIPISWQVNGTSAMTAFSLEFFDNDYESTILTTTPIITLDTPFYGTDNHGNPVFFTYNLDKANLGDSSWLENGKSFKFKITQYWGANNENMVFQYTESLFLTRATPVVSVPNLTATVSDIFKTFVGSYSQADGDAINSCRWKLAKVQSGGVYDVLDDTGNIVTGVLSYTYYGLLSGTQYAVSLEVESASGMKGSTGWLEFSVQYTETDDSQTFSAICTDDSSNLIDLTQIEQGSGTVLNSLYRRSEEGLRLISLLPDGVDQIKDFGGRSNTQYVYELAQHQTSGTFTAAIASAPVSRQLKSYYLMEATEDMENPNVYHVLHVWKFGNNLSAGSISNNNSPGWLSNFTPYRLRQHSTRMGKSGTLQALLSNYDQERLQYSDTVSMQERLYQASSSNNAFFLKDMKGNLYMVHISAPIVQTINIKSTVQQVTVSVPWEEIGNADEIALIQLPTDQGWKKNMVSLVSLDVDLETGMLIATYPANYFGTTFNLDGTDLVAVTNTGVPKADISLEENQVVVTTDS
jgi:hypothetical protein